MSPRSIFAIGVSFAILTPAFAGIVSKNNGKHDDAAAPVVASVPASADKQAADGPVKNEKALLNRLVKELQRSSRSFIYLRTLGFTQSDREFERLIASNDEVFRSVRIIRRDEQGNRQIPGWPGIALSESFKGETR